MSKPPIILKEGDDVEIDCDGRKVDGKIVLASGNGQSLMLSFDAMLRGFVMMMPVLWKNGKWIDFHGRELGIEKKLVH